MLIFQYCAALQPDTIITLAWPEEPVLMEKVNQIEAILAECAKSQDMILFMHVDIKTRVNAAIDKARHENGQNTTVAWQPGHYLRSLGFSPRFKYMVNKITPETPNDKYLEIILPVLNNGLKMLELHFDWNERMNKKRFKEKLEDLCPVKTDNKKVKL